MNLFARSRRVRGGEGGGSSSESAGNEDDNPFFHRRSQRSQLEEEVQRLQEQLQEELDLHIILANAAGDTALRWLSSSVNVPEKAQELLVGVAELEIAVSKLEDELVSLRFRLSQERNERRLHEHRLSRPNGSLSFCYSCDEQESSLEFSTCRHLPDLLQPDILEHFHSPSSSSQRNDDVSESSVGSLREEEVVGAPQLDLVDDASAKVWARDLHLDPNKLSEEMVRCMRNIYLCLSKSSDLSPSTFSFIPCPSSPMGHLSPFLTSPSGSTVMPSFSPSLTSELRDHFGNNVRNSRLDPYGVRGRDRQTDIGSYRSAVEVSWMTVGKKQLEYAAEALKEFRVLVELLAKVDPSEMTCNQRLAFWINLYNALIMHAYLAYGVPGSDAKLFSLMQKASYTVGGHSFSAAEIEYILLRMKPPAHRPQMALILALHKFKISEEHRRYSLEVPEPLAVFALSCGMYSSPAVRIFTAENVYEELQSSLRAYVRASVGINDKGKLLVPKLLYCFAKGVVEDSLLVDWICRFLAPEQVSLVRDSTSQRKQRLLGARMFTVSPFDSRFRYLFAIDDETSS